jgi:hypothetical protein
MNKKASSEFNYEKKYLEIFGKKMAYVDKGQGDPTVFFAWKSNILISLAKYYALR